MQKKGNNANTTQVNKVNLQHSRLATDNLRHIIKEESTYIIFIQEPYTIWSNIAGLSKNFYIGGRKSLGDHNTE